MKFEKVFKTILLPTAMISLVTSCGDDFDFESHYPGGDVKKEYADNWEKVFGKINPEQNWSMVQKSSVTVSVDSESDIQIYANNGSVFNLVADYKAISGTQTLEYDAIKGTKEIIVSNGNNKVLTNAGETIFWGGQTRGSILSPSDPVSVSIMPKTGSPVEYDINFINNSISGENGGKSINSGYDTSNFTFIATSNKIIIYPMYWSTHDIIDVGIYLDGNLSKLYPIFTSDDKNAPQDKFIPVEYFTSSDNTWHDLTRNSGTSYSVPSGAVKFRSYGIEVEVPVGSEIGFYGHKTTGNKNYFYSEKEFNNGIPKVSCVTVPLNAASTTLVGMNSKDSFKDFVFAIDNVVAVTNDTQKWRIACEDLGSTGDYDFNDLVFEVSLDTETKGGKTTITGTKILPLAAGGTLEAKYSIDGQNWSHEIHEKFTANNKNSSGKYLMFNTNATRVGLEGRDGLSSSADIMSDVNRVSDVFDKLKIRVYRDGTSQDAVIVSAPDKGSAPQMIMVPDNWRWPIEKESIEVAYPGFINWSMSATNDQWINSNNNHVDILYSAPSN